MAIGSVKTKRFLSRVMAEINEVKVGRTSPVEGMDPELAEVIGAGVNSSLATAATIRDKVEVRRSRAAPYVASPFFFV